MAKRRANGEGSIFQRKSDNYWVGRYPIGRNENGSIKFRIFYGKKQSEVLEKMNKAKGFNHYRSTKSISINNKNNEYGFKDKITEKLLRYGWNVKREIKVKHGYIDILAEMKTKKVIIEAKMKSNLNSVQGAIGQLILYKQSIPEAELYYASPDNINSQLKATLHSLGIKMIEELFSNKNNENYIEMVN